jgi:ATP-dependent helicase YprA (DUF1998 family)
LKFLSSSTSKKNSVGEGGEEKEEDPISGSFHALEHALIESSDSLTSSGSSDIGGVSMGDSGVTFVYDGSPGGSGISILLFDRLDEALDRTLIILMCKCTSSDGCSLCTYSYPIWDGSSLLGSSCFSMSAFVRCLNSRVLNSDIEALKKRLTILAKRRAVKIMNANERAQGFYRYMIRVT